MALKYTKRVKFAYDYDWVEDDLSLPNIIVGVLQIASALQKCKPKIWEVLINQYGVDPFEVPFVQRPSSSDFYKFQPWFDPFIRRYIPPLCDGALNDAPFSFKWISCESQEEPIPEKLDLNVNVYELKKVTEYYVIQTLVRRVVSGANEVNFVTSYRVLLYTSNF